MRRLNICLQAKVNALLGAGITGQPGLTAPGPVPGLPALPKAFLYPSRTCWSRVRGDLVISPHGKVKMTVTLEKVGGWCLSTLIEKERAGLASQFGLGHGDPGPVDCSVGGSGKV